MSDFLQDALDNEQLTNQGFEQIDNSTMSVQFLRVAQTLTPALKKNKAEYIEGLEEGCFYNTASRTNYGSEINVIALQFKKMYIEWLPNRGGFVSSHSIENAERLATDKTFGRWKTAEGNDLQENYVYALLIEGYEHEGPVFLALNSTNIKEAKKWNRMLISTIMSNGKRALPYFLKWKLTTVMQSNDQGEWYSIVVDKAGFINEEQFNITNQERTALPDTRVDYAQIEGPASNEDLTETSF